MPGRCICATSQPSASAVVSTLELHVHADAADVVLEVRGRRGVHDRLGAVDAHRVVGVAQVAEVDVEVLALDRPAIVDGPLDAGAGGPANTRVRRCAETIPGDGATNVEALLRDRSAA